MNGDWQQIAFSDAVLIDPAVQLKKGQSYSYIEMKDVTANERYTKPSQIKPWSGGSRFAERDILFARITPCLENGKIAQAIDLEGGVGFGSTEFIVLRGRPGISDTEFVHYLSVSQPVRRHAEKSMSGTSGRQRVSVAAFDALRIELPPLSIQRRIADILGALDDKIECNRRMNATLETMAQALYKHWFVDVESSELPDDWEMATVGNLCEFAYGKGLKETERTEGQYPVYGSAGVIGTHKDYLVKAPGLVVGRKGTIGKVHRARLPFFPIDTTFYIVPKTPEYSFDFLYLLLGRLDLDKRNNDSAVPGLNRNDVYKLPVVKPPKAVLENFNAKVAPLFQQIDSNDKENQTLARTRDYLLPKLLSGEVEVKVAEKQIAESS